MPSSATKSPAVKAKSKAQKRPKLLLIDGYSLAFRAFYALPEDLSTSDGTHTNAVFGFTSMLIKVLQDEKPEHIACCLDMGAPLERTEAFADYKATRTEAPETFSSQVPLIREVLKVMKIPIFELAGHEADDIIAFLAKSSETEGVDVRIVTGDRDFFQLVNDNIHVLYNRRGISDIVEMDPAAVEERYGVPPERYVDLKALEGDNSDNLPGVPGVGTKTAAKLIQRYGSAEAAVDHADEQTPKLAQNLAAHAAQVGINKQLSTLVQVPLEDVSLDELKLGAWDLDAIKELFSSLEFRVLLERLMADLPEAAEGEGEAFELETHVVNTDAELLTLAENLRSAGRFALDIVAVSPRGRPRSLAFSWGEGRTAYVPVGTGGHEPGGVSAALRSLLEDVDVSKDVHGGRAALLALDAMDVGLTGLQMDTHVGTYLLDPGAAGYALEEMARKYSGRELKAVDGVGRREEEGGQGALALEGDPDELDAEDGSLRALAIAEVAAAVEPELERLGMHELYLTIERPLIPVLAAMEKVGVKVDLDYLAEIGRDLEKRIGELEADCYGLAGERLNLGSPPQLRALLYDKFGLTTRRKTPKGELSTDALALRPLAGEHPFIETLLKYREAAKLKNTYVDPLPLLIDSVDGRLHTQYDQTSTATGRLSSVNPNLQNIPIRTEIGKQIRKAFIPEAGFDLLSADYSQIELRVMAHLSEDPILLEVFAKGEDIHTATAIRVFGLDAGKLSTKHRSTAKMINYGLQYGMAAPGLAERLNIPQGEAQEVMDAYFEQFAGVKKYLDSNVTKASANGYTTTMFGRRATITELGSGNPRVRAIGERRALASPIQGTAADIMKLALINVSRALQDSELKIRMILTVHDELLFEVDAAEQAAAAELVEREMTGVCELKVPLAVDVSFGANWAAAKG